MSLYPCSSGATLMLGAVAALVPSSATAQDADTTDLRACTALVSPAQVPTGAQAVRVTVTLSRDAGPVTGVEEGPEGIILASPEDVPRTEMAAGDEPPDPVWMDADGDTWTLWLNTSEAEEGTHALRFVAETSRCVGELEVIPSG